MRCLTLADALHAQGAECTFICRPHTGHLLDLIAQRGHKAVALPSLHADATSASDDSDHAHWLGTDWATDAADTRQLLGNASVNWLVVDHYALDNRWEQALRHNCQRLMVIDDLADRSHDCDLLLDQNLGRTTEDYSGLTPGNTTRLIGPQYALLRSEFSKLRAESLARRIRPQLKRLLITMGGVDKDNATGLLLNAMKTCPLPERLEITVVMGPHAPWLQHIQAQALKMPWSTQVLVGVSNMAQLMKDSDLAIGAAGGTTWERCCLGLPSFTLVLAKNQQAGAIALQNFGGTLAMNSVEEIMNLLQSTSVENRIRYLLLDLCQAAQQVADGLGATRTSRKILEYHA
jgi:UDP-2,4-diacetamido-2,4,6-trideoxy-beta-L-altropyranose hydrolase